MISRKQIGFKTRFHPALLKPNSIKISIMLSTKFFLQHVHCHALQIKFMYSTQFQQSSRALASSILASYQRLTKSGSYVILNSGMCFLISAASSRCKAHSCQIIEDLIFYFTGACMIFWLPQSRRPCTSSAFWF
jgi:hypothetical protein